MVRCICRWKGEVWISALPLSRNRAGPNLPQCGVPLHGAAGTAICLSHPADRPFGSICRSATEGFQSCATLLHFPWYSFEGRNNLLLSHKCLTSFLAQNKKHKSSGQILKCYSEKMISVLVVNYNFCSMVGQY